jgi:hypothetical protein
VQHGLGLAPAQARIGDRHTALQRHTRHQVLPAGLEVALDHQTDDPSLAAGHLRGHVVRHLDLPLVALGGVGVRAVHHHALGQAGLAQGGAGGLHIGGTVVGLAPAAQDHVAGVVAAGLEHRRLAHLGHAHEGVRRARRDDRIGRHLHAAIGAVLEADRARQAAGELAVRLALGGARADRAPGHQVGDVLRAQQVEELAAGRQARRGHVEQQLAGAAQALVDAPAAVEPRVVDVALPAHRGARFLEVHAHHHQQLAGERVGGALEVRGVLERLVVVVDRAGPDHHHEPVVGAGQDRRDRLARAAHQCLGSRRQRQFILQQRGRDQRADGRDAQVVDAGGVVGDVGHGRQAAATAAHGTGAGGSRALH